MSISTLNYSNRSVRSGYNDWSMYISKSEFSHSVLELVFLWRTVPAITLPFILNRAMGLVGLRKEAKLFYIAISGSLDYDYAKASELICQVAEHYGPYFLSFWYDITQNSE
ncbi:MAG: hypothetical protein ACTSVZ_12260 [Promethearchaeota archaeon]